MVEPLTVMKVSLSGFEAFQIERELCDLDGVIISVCNTNCNTFDFSSQLALARSVML